MASHRYWRITISKSSSGADNLISFSEVEMRGAIDGADLCSGGSSQASHNNSSVYKLFDDDFNLYWTNGGPSATCWFQYDFSSGDVEVKQLWFMPRQPLQNPEDFTISSSDDGVVWLEEAAWSGVGGWLAGVGKSFALPRPVVNKQQGQPSAIALGQKNRQPAALGIFAIDSLLAPFGNPLAVQNRQPVPIMLARDNISVYAPRGEEQNEHPYSIILTVASLQGWKRWLLSHLSQPIYSELLQAQKRAWSLRTTLGSQQSFCFSRTSTVQRQSRQPSDLLIYNQVSGKQRRYWDLAATGNLQQVWLPTIKINGLPAAITDLVIKASQDHFGWQAEIGVADESSWLALELDQQFILEIDQESFTLLLDDKSSHRDGEGNHVRTLLAISPAARHALPRAVLISREWQESLLAKDIVEELLVEPVNWQLLNWPIMGGRLKVSEQSPLQTVQAIASAIGGVVNSHCDGTIKLQARFPLAVDAWDGAVVDHTFSDVADNLEIRQSHRRQRYFDHITIYDGDPEQSSGFLTIDIDRRESGPNRGKTRFSPGETTHLLLTPGPGVEPTAITTSTANVIAQGRVTYDVVDDLAFVNSDKGRLSRPISQVVQYSWLGSDLGTPVLAADGMTVTTPNRGTAILRLMGVTTAESYQFQSPKQLDGLDSFPVAFSCSGTSSQSAVGAVTLQKNNGSYPGGSVISELLTSDAALRERGEQELNRAALLGQVEIAALYRPGLAPGQLVEVHDAHFGQTFRGMLTAVIHKIDNRGPRSNLTLVKK